MCQPFPAGVTGNGRPLRVSQRRIIASMLRRRDWLTFHIWNLLAFPLAAIHAGMDPSDEWAWIVAFPEAKENAHV